MKKVLIAVSVILVFLFATTIQIFAQEVYVCKDKRGKGRFVDDPNQCKPGETLLILNASGPQGPPGEDGLDGLHCWDLNENGTCDLLEEDKNKDGECDAVDCKGAAHAYDADGQYLGILNSVGGGLDLSQIFIPSLEIATVITEDININPGTGNVILLPQVVWFKDLGCSGDAYLKAGCDMLFRIEDPDSVAPPRYFYGITPLLRSVSLSSYMTWIGGCTDRPFSDEDVYQAVEVFEGKIPFNLPVKLPLLYK